MLTIYSPVQRTHRPAYVVKQGERSSSFDVPERIDSILSAINEQELGPVIAPDDAGLESIRLQGSCGAQVASKDKRGPTVRTCVCQ